jgi:cell division protein FtsL
MNIAEMNDFLQCEMCNEKGPGAILLCTACVHNRDAIARLQTGVAISKDKIGHLEAERDRLKTKVKELLRYKRIFRIIRMLILGRR